MSDGDPKKVTEVFSMSAALERLEELERERGPDLEYMLRDAHRPFHDPYTVYRIELADPILRIAPHQGHPRSTGTNCTELEHPR